jgi:hypothetical protein
MHRTVDFRLRDLSRIEFVGLTGDEMVGCGEAWVGEDGVVHGSNDTVDGILDGGIKVPNVKRPGRTATRADGPLMLYGYMAEAMTATLWGARLLDPAPDGEETIDFPAALEPLVDHAWELHGRARELAPENIVDPSMPILFFGDLFAYLRSVPRIITVGLNPSLAEFPTSEPWLRFPGAARLGPRFTRDTRKRYLYSLCDYFKTRPYRKWFDRSFEPLLNGLDASYYSDAGVVALHTDVASPVATTPTWSKLRALRGSLEQEGWQLWRELAQALRPDLVIVSTARHHLHAITPIPFGDWRELGRVDRERPFIVSGTTTLLGGERTVVAFGRCTNVPFGSVSFTERHRLGEQLAEHLAAERAAR